MRSSLHVRSQFRISDLCWLPVSVVSGKLTGMNVLTKNRMKLILLPLRDNGFLFKQDMTKQLIPDSIWVTLYLAFY